MARQNIAVGAAPNDGNGDPVRTAYTKCNENFDELYGGPNRVIDGQFKLWDKGTSFTADGYSATMWHFLEGGGAATVTRQDFALGQTVVPGNPKHFLRHLQSANGTDVEMSQPLGDVSLFSGEDLTIEIYADTASGSLLVTPAIRQNFGTGGSPSTEVETVGGAWTILDTGMAKYSVTIPVPSVFGKDLGDDDDYLELVFKFPDTTTFTFDIANVSRVPGTSGFTGAWRTKAEERLLVHESFQVHGDFNEGVAGINVFQTLPNNAGTPSTARRININYYTPMRSKPDVTLPTPNDGTLDSTTAGRQGLRVNCTASTTSAAQAFSHLLLDARLRR